MPKTNADQHLPPDVQQFLRTHISALYQLEMLLLMVREGQRGWTPDEIAQALYLHADAVAAQLTTFAEQGLVAVVNVSRQVYAFQGGAHTDTLARIATLYRDRRVTLTTFIFSQPSEVVRSFADAFKIRKE